MKYLISALLLLGAFVAQAQLPTITLKGYVAVEGGTSFNYKLVFTDSADIVKGYSLTAMDNNGGEAKAMITGMVDRPNKIFQFHETEVVYNHGFQSDVTMCLINAALKYVTKNTGSVLTGRITSVDMANTDCGAGNVTFINEDGINALFNSPDKKEVAAAPAAAPQAAPMQRPVRPTRTIVEIIDPNEKKPAPVAEVEKITTGVEKVYEWENDSVIIAVWDGGNIDGDKVTILYNGQNVLTNYTLTAERKTIYLKPTPGSIDEITITAVNEGNEPPNTANLQLRDGQRKYDLVAYNSIGRSSMIKIKKIQAK